MASWQPPIPHGALCSRQVRDLGPAVALLGWCWDNVRRDGCLDLQLKEIAADMDESYFTVVKWWKRLQDGPFFTSVTDRGRSGYRVQFADEWIEWRILSTRSNKAAGKFELPEMVTEDEMPDPVTDQQLSAPIIAQEPLKRSSVAAELPEMVTDTPAYKVLNTTDQTCIAPVASDDAPPPRASRKKHATPKADEPASPIEVRQAVAKGSGIDLATGLDKDIIQVNRTAKHLWLKIRPEGQSVDAFLLDIRACGKWIRLTQHPYRGSEQLIPPSALIKFWPSWLESRAKTTPAYTNGANGHQPAERMPTPEETAAFAARYNPRIPGRTV